MRIDVVSFTKKGLLEVKVSHQNEEMLWDVRIYDKSNQIEIPVEGEDDDGDDRVFNDINEYWATISHERQTAIWNAYQKMYIVLQTNFDVQAILPKLQKLVKELYSQMPFEEVRRWVDFHGNIRVPSNINNDYEPIDARTKTYLPRERTYLMDDYMDLVSLSVAIRPMVPIWGEFISRTRSEIGTNFKEFIAMKLLYSSSIIQSPPMVRLKEYVQHSIDHSDQKGASFAAKLDGMGSTEQPDWLLATTVVRRVAIVPVSSNNDDVSIIANIYRFISNTLRSLDRRFGGRVTEKNPPSGGGEDANISQAEMYKVKQSISDGDLQTLIIYTEQYREMALRIEPDIDLNKVEEAIQAVTKLTTINGQYQHQITMAQWVVAPCMSPLAIPLLPKAALHRIIAVTQAVLWHWKFYDLAVLASATPVPLAKDTMVGGLEGRGRIPKEYMKELEVRYPHQRHPRGKNQSARHTNVASIAIDTLCDMLGNEDWVLHGPVSLIKLSNHIPSSNRLITPADLRTQLAQLTIKLHDIIESGARRSF